MRQVGIVIVNYNGKSFQKACLDSIFKSSYKNYKIIIVDNGSTDGSMEEVEQLFDSRITTIYNGANLGVAAANNIGINKGIELGCDCTLLLNNDTEIAENTIEILEKHLDKFKAVSPKILFWDTKNIWYFGGSFDRTRGRNVHWHYNKVNENLNDSIICDYAPTCCLMLDNSLFSEIGLMDEKYFLYFDDTDFCMRMKINKFPIFVTPLTEIYHKVSASTGKKFSYVRTYYLNRNRLYFLQKFKKEFSFFTYVSTWIVRYMKGWFGNQHEKKYVKEAIKDYKKHNMGGKAFL